MTAQPAWVAGERIRVERQRRRMSLAQLAGQAGISKTYLIRLETDVTANPSLEVLKRIADVLDVTVADLVDGPSVRLVPTELEIPSSLRAFADEAQLSKREIETLASIRWRRGEEPRTASRWRYILDSLRASKTFDDDDR